MTDLLPGQVQIGRNVYDTVARRIHLMRSDEKDYQLETELLKYGEQKVLMKATLKDSEGNIISTGHAEEDRGADSFTETSAVEVCETSAVGRCLGNAFWSGSETAFDPQIASADEVTTAIRAGQNKQYGAYMALVNEHWDSIVAIKQFLADGNMAAAVEAYDELGHDTMIALWKAPTKGGIFTTKERSDLKEGRENTG
jgi:hypothetical protein